MDSMDIRQLNRRIEEYMNSVTRKLNDDEYQAVMENIIDYAETCHQAKKEEMSL